jgi:F0F1-type ATP synthase epsilon subunit
MQDQRLNELVDAVIGIREHTTAHERAVERGLILVRTITADVLATSAIEGVALDERTVQTSVFQKLCERGVL